MRIGGLDRFFQVNVNTLATIPLKGILVSSGTCGVPNPTTNISENPIPKGTTYKTLQFLDLTDFNEHRCPYFDHIDNFDFKNNLL
jgi:hypothetical protein